jgi:signal transduction histidine kinase
VEKVRLLVDLQLVVTFFLVTLLWSFSARLRKQEFFRLWAWAWTSFVVFLGLGTISLHVTPRWHVLKDGVTLFTVEAGFLQVALLILGVLSLQTGERSPPRRLRWGLGLGIAAGALTFAVSRLRAESPLSSFSLRTAPRTLALAVALLFCARAFFRNWRAHRSRAELVTAIFCALYAVDQGVYSFTAISYLIFGSPATPGELTNLSLLARPLWLLLDSIYTFGIGIGLIMMLLEKHERIQRALFEGSLGSADISEQNVALKAEIYKRERVEKDLRNLSIRLMQAQEEERTSIARELHDDVGAQLLLAKLKVTELKRECSEKGFPLVEPIEAVSAALRTVGEHVRLLSHHLHSLSLELLGLVPALTEFCKELGERSGLQIEFVHAGVPSGLPREIVICFYRIAQEALRNIQRHSGSPSARVELKTSSDRIQLRVSDKGKGFDPALVGGGQGLGLASMAERVRNLGGQFLVQSQPGHGTSITASFLIAGNSPETLPAAS